MTDQAIRRIMKELKDISKNPVREITICALESNAMEVHFTYLGPKDSPYEKGIYHGRVVIPKDYPFAPPDVILLTPNGRFETGKRVCLSVSSYHPEKWKPTWGITTVIYALREFMLTPGNNGIGSVTYSEKQRRTFAEESWSYKCKICEQNVQNQYDEIMSKVPPAEEMHKAPQFLKSLELFGISTPSQSEGEKKEEEGLKDTLSEDSPQNTVSSPKPLDLSSSSPTARTTAVIGTPLRKTERDKNDQSIDLSSYPSPVCGATDLSTASLPDPQSPQSLRPLESISGSVTNKTHSSGIHLQSNTVSNSTEAYSVPVAIQTSYSPNNNSPSGSSTTHQKEANIMIGQILNDESQKEKSVTDSAIANDVKIVEDNLPAVDPVGPLPAPQRPVQRPRDPFELRISISRIDYCQRKVTYLFIFLILKKILFDHWESTQMYLLQIHGAVFGK